MPLNEGQIEEIVERAANRAVEKMRAAAYQDIGKWTIHKAAWVVTAGVVGLWWWMLKNGWIKP